LLAIAASLLPFPAAIAATEGVGSGGSGAQPITTDIVVLVDESGSQTPYSVRQEAEAAEAIAQGGLNSASRVTVVGFGSNNGLPGQQAATQVCRPTAIGSAPARQYLATCVAALHRRTFAQGWDTDFAAAMAQAMSYFSGPPPKGVARAIFLETDGVLDVHASPQYGSVAADRDAQAQQDLGQELAAASTAGVQVWPLGFGPQASLTKLAAFASGGYQQGCVRPRPQLVSDPAEVVQSLAKLFASASCEGQSPFEEGSVGGGTKQVTLSVPIPPIATDGTITVDKGSPAVAVTYTDPDGHLVSPGSYNGSQVILSGTGTVTESLHVTNPVTGTWKVTLKAPPGLARQLVSATALWQGAVRASVFPEPPSVTTGQHMVIKLSLLTRKGAITNGAALHGMSFSVVATGDGLAAPVTIPLNDNGAGADATAGDGSFTGTFTAPHTPGALTFTGQVRGYGLYPTEIPATVQVSSVRALVEGSVSFPATAGNVYPGATVHGTLTAVNRTGAARRVRLILGTPPATRAAIVSPRGAFSLPSGNSVTHFTIVLARNSALGGTSLSVRLADSAQPAQVYGAGQLNITVANPPGPWQKYKWIILGAAALVLALITLLLVRRAARRARIAVHGLRASLSRDGEPVGVEVRAPRKWSPEFRFVIRDPAGQYPRLDNPQSGDHPYVARRAQDGRVTVRTPDGEKHQILLGSQGEALDNGLVLAFHDSRRRRPPTRRGSASAGAGHTGATAGPGTGRAGGIEPDPWL
jgi:hypothetical protein